MDHIHNFIRINDVNKPRAGNNVSWHGQIDGAIAGCIECGQIRRVFTDGTVEIVVAGGEPIVDHGRTQ